MRRCLLLLVSFAPLVGAQPGFIHGTVVDLHDAVLVGAQVRVKSSSTGCDAVTNERGEFNCQLPAGRYQLTATNFAMLPYQRGIVTVKPRGHHFLKLWTVPAPEQFLTVDGDRYGTPIPVQHYRETIDDGLDVVIRYMREELQDQSIKFLGPYLMLTSELLTIQANEMSCTKPVRTCVAIGEVRIDSNEEKFEGASVQIDLSNRSFVLTRAANVSGKF